MTGILPLVPRTEHSRCAHLPALNSGKPASRADWHDLISDTSRPAAPAITGNL